VGWRLLLGAAIVVSTLGLAIVVTLLPGVPRWWGPLPLTVVVPFFIVGPVLAFVPVLVLALGLSVPLLLARVRVPWWTTIPILGIAAISWFYFVCGIGYGVEYQGPAYVVACGAIQSACTGGLAVLWVLNRRRRSYALVAVWHALAALWLASYAFPYYGELP
jgi:hypothetical protein